MNLELQAMRWLWIQKNCHYIVEQRSPRYMMGSPDVVGITAQRYLIEVEIKRSLSDFMADFKKPHRINREFYLKHQPKFFYYCVPSNLTEKVLPRLPEWAGLLHSGENGYICSVVKPSPANNLSERLSLKECAKATRHIVNHSMSLRLEIEKWKNIALREEIDPEVWAYDKTVGFYQI